TLFYAACDVTGQPKPSGRYSFYVFPQVSLGQVIRASPSKSSLKWRADEAHGAINSRRCDLLIADTQGSPVAVFEYQGGAHNIDGDAAMRDEIKRIAVEEAASALLRSKTEPAEPK
ncbi:MAG: DUF2726 domain-containing protein, partial [Acetobacteraceae bacterium]|nr:DUF2726 domain-containing protein [Acetobacteraceae bacterium]